MKKRILSILLTLVMVIGMLPTVAFAAETTDVELFDALDIFLQIGSTVCADYGDESFRVTEDPVNGAWNVTYTVQKIANYEYLYNINVNLKDAELAATESISFHYKGKAHSDCDHANVSFNVHAEGDCYVPTIGAFAEVSEENKANNTGVVDSTISIHDIFHDEMNINKYSFTYNDETGKSENIDWRRTVDEFIDDSDDDIVFVGIDYHI